MVACHGPWVGRHRWNEVRDRWLAGATRTLEADARVVGVGLVGSFGRGEADRWSDLDLLVVIEDAGFTAWAAENELWRQAEFLWRAPQNTRATATSVGTLHVTDALPVGVDWYVYRATEAAWPTDCAVILGRDFVSATDLTFRDWNALGPRGAPPAVSAEDRLAARVAMTTIAGKYVVRGSPDAARMIEFLTGDAASEEPTAQLAALEDFVRRAGRLSLAAPILAYLAQVREDVRSEGDA